MSIEKLDGFLSAFGLMNDGCNHCSEYAIYVLPDANSLKDSLNLYFSSLYTSSKLPQPASAWQIKYECLGAEWRGVLIERFKYWFFEQEFSPKVEDWAKDNCATTAIDFLVEGMTDFKVYSILVTPPMWYDCQWQDFAIAFGGKSWLLHLGFSD